MYKILIVFCALLLAGCGAAGTPSRPTTAPAAPTTAPEAAPTPTTGGSTTQDNEVVAVWTRSGGFAGLTDKLTIYADGRLVTEGDSGSNTVQGDPAAVQALQALVTGSDWQSLDAKYGEQFPDAFAYTIEAGGKTVLTYDGVETPAVLTQVQQQINQLFNAANQSGS